MRQPSDPRLTPIAESLEATKWAAEIWNTEWRLEWVSEETKAIIGSDDEATIGYGRHIVEARWSEPWLSSVSERTRADSMKQDWGFIAHDTPGGAEGLATIFRNMGGDPPATLRAVAPPPLWTGIVELTQPGMAPIDARFVALRLHDENGEFIGTTYVYGATLPARLLAFVTRGSQAMFTRMAELVEPGRRVAAVLFADLQASGALSRRLSSAVYFRLVRELTTAMDTVIVRRRGIVGKHAGDGVSAFFLADEFESASAAAAAAVEAAHDLRREARRVADEVGRATGLFDASDCPMNVGIHWGGTLYMGQVVTGGRLEVTALGDEVNECARIQQCTRDGAVLASKALIERLVDGDARRVGIDPQEVVYRTLADLPGADAKSIRDAGTLSVTELFADERLEASPPAAGAAQVP
jgi:class 3 adenylate cyclase